MKPTLFLDKPNQSKPTRIILSIANDYDRVKIPTGEKIEPKFWNKKQHCARSTYQFAAEINQRLKVITDTFEVAVQALVKSNKQLTREVLEKEYKKLATAKPDEAAKKPKTPSFFDFIDKFISDSETGKRLIDGHKLSFHTVKGYKVTRNHLKAYQTETRRRLSFDTLDANFYDSFINFFYEKDLIVKDKSTGEKITRAKGHTMNSVGKHIKNLKVFAREAFESGIKVHPDLNKRKFKVIAEDTDQIALTVDELTKINQVDLSQSPRLDHVRDCFLLGAFSGLRFSDLQQLNEHNIIDNKSIRVTTQKTGQKVVIPLHPIVRKILEKHDGIPPTPISNQKMNAYIKEVATLADLTDSVIFGKTRAGDKEVKTLPKCELITVHTARRSFATNLYLAGMDLLTIKKMTGHKTERSFLKYIRVSEEENAARAAQHSFFN